MAEQFVVAGEEGDALGVYPHELAAWIAVGAEVTRLRAEYDTEEDAAAPLRWVIEKYDHLPDRTELRAYRTGQERKGNQLAQFVITRLEQAD